MTPDLRLYALVDPAVAGGRTLPELATLIAPATTIVQLRDKHGSTRDMVATARAEISAEACRHSAADQ